MARACQGYQKNLVEDELGHSPSEPKADLNLANFLEGPSECGSGTHV